jgi:hypothetical protein
MFGNGALPSSCREDHCQRRENRLKRKRKAKRDYAAEYKRRMARGKKRGLSASAANGHYKRGEAGILASKFLGIRPGEKLRAIDAEDFVNWKRLRKIVAKDARLVFGKKPKRGSEGDEDYAAEYQLRLQELAAARGDIDGKFDWQDEGHFVAQMMSIGSTERQAYTFWFSP